ncbi:hypothetical protein RyT2_23750 [Pseudolactococcus yaeyamensis]
MTEQKEQELLDEIKQAVKLHLIERIKNNLRFMSQSELARFKDSEQFLGWSDVWISYGNFSDEIADMGVDSIYQIGDMIDYVTVALAKRLEIETKSIKVYLPRADFACCFEKEKETRGGF